MRAFRPLLVALLVAGSSVVSASGAAPPLLLRRPSVSATEIVFSFAGDLWLVAREGGDARRLTAGVGFETDPVFSPDGSEIAFTGEYDGNRDVFVVPASGGVPRRLTAHPGNDDAVGWTPDGKSVLFRSSRVSPNRESRLYLVPKGGGPATELPLPSAYEGSFSPDGARLAYVPVAHFQRAWKRYRGGMTNRIWIARLSDSAIQKVPRENSNDSCPMWVGKTIYFLSDRNGPVTLFAYDTETHAVREAVKNDGLDLKAASAGGGLIVYEQFGALRLFDPATGRVRPVDVRLTGDFPEVRPHFVKVDPKRFLGYSLSPTGARAAFEARGEILTVPAEKGDIRDLTRTPGAAERDPAWSPDGQWVASFSDASGEYALELLPQSGLGERKTIFLGNPPSFFYSPTWSPDGKKIAYTDKRLNVWVADVESGTTKKIDTDLYETPLRTLVPVWSPDSRWLAYPKFLKSHFHAIAVHSLEDGTTRLVTDGMSDASSPAFDASGKYLWFLASTDVGLTAGWLDMSSIGRTVSRSAYVAVLRKDLPSPLAPESDEEKKPDAGERAADGKGKAEPAAKGKAGEASKAKPEPVRIDFDGFSQRILALPLPAADYDRLVPGKEGVVFLTEAPAVLFDPHDDDGPTPTTVHRFDLKTRKSEKLADGVTAFALSGNGEKMLLRQGESWAIVPADKPPKPGEGVLKLAGMEVWSDPRAEWRQMYHEVWRIERDFLYDPHAHGLDLAATEKKYAPWLDGLASRADLNYLFEEMLGNLTLGHVYVARGDMPQAPKVKGGLLGADWSLENGRYRFRRVYDGENWNPHLKAPLTQPGVNVVAGDYLLAVNGRNLTAADDVDAFLEGTAGKEVVLRVGPSPEGTGARDVTVVPVESELGLRNLAWIEGNRRKVDEMTGGRVAYVYLPNTAGRGYLSFNRYYFAQVGKDAAILDERFNGGGDIADYIIDYLRRPLMAVSVTREGADQMSPLGSIFGPKVMLINQSAGSGGDAMPWLFRKAGIGPLVGTRTWGGLVGIYDYPVLLDGGFVTAPRIGIHGLKGEWEVENVGIAPDVEVELDPKVVREGHDPQLEKGVEVVLELLKKNPPPTYVRPPFPNYQSPAAK